MQLQTWHGVENGILTRPACGVVCGVWDVPARPVTTRDQHTTYMHMHMHMQCCAYIRAAPQKVV